MSNIEPASKTSLEMASDPISAISSNPDIDSTFSRSSSPLSSIYSAIFDEDTIATDSLPQVVAAADLEVSFKIFPKFPPE